jgi:stalled ribosome rescue protein Dom34
MSGSASDPELRKKYVKLVEGVQQNGAEVVMFSSMHESGQRTLPNVVLYAMLMMLQS